MCLGDTSQRNNRDTPAPKPEGHRFALVSTSAVPATQYRKSRYSPECRLFCVWATPRNATTTIRPPPNPKAIGSLWFQRRRSPLPNTEKADTHQSVGFFVSGRHLATQQPRYARPQTRRPSVRSGFNVGGPRYPIQKKPILTRVSAFLYLAFTHHHSDSVSGRCSPPIRTAYPTSEKHHRLAPPPQLPGGRYRAT